MTFFGNFLALTCIVFLRYVAVAGGLYLLCYRWKKTAWELKKLNKAKPDPLQMKEEFFWSALTSFVFGGVGAWMFHLWEEGKTLVYLDFQSRGVSYALLSLFLMLLVHDTYFYWSHRLLHHPWVYRKIHRTHHLSIYPSPWAAFCFHPVEAILQALFLPLILFLIPAHPVVLFVFLMVMTVLGVINHLGYELYPKAFLRNKLAQSIISATNHSEHHLMNRSNFALYFTWWDLAMGTLTKKGVGSSDRPASLLDKSSPQLTHES